MKFVTAFINFRDYASYFIVVLLIGFKIIDVSRRHGASAPVL